MIGGVAQSFPAICYLLLALRADATADQAWTYTDSPAFASRDEAPSPAPSTAVCSTGCKDCYPTGYCKPNGCMDGFKQVGSYPTRKCEFSTLTPSTTTLYSLQGDSAFSLNHHVAELAWEGEMSSMVTPPPLDLGWDGGHRGHEQLGQHKRSGEKPNITIINTTELTNTTWKQTTNSSRSTQRTVVAHELKTLEAMNASFNEASEVLPLQLEKGTTTLGPVTNSGLLESNHAFTMALFVAFLVGAIWRCNGESAEDMLSINPYSGRIFGCGNQTHTDTVTFNCHSLIVEGQVTESPKVNEEPSLLLTNTRLFALLLLVYGQFLLSCSGGINSRSHSLRHPDRENTGGSAHIDLDTWLKGAEPLAICISRAVAYIQLPMICFVSGVCSKGSSNSQRFLRYIRLLLIPTLLWIFMVKPVIFDSLLTLRTTTFRTRVHELVHLQAFHAEWYLQALCFWRGSVLLFWSHCPSSVSLFLMMLISCVGAGLTFEGPIKHVHVKETLLFYPYFAIGYVFPFRTCVIAMNKLWLQPIQRHLYTCAGIATVCWCFIAPIFMFPDKMLSGDGLYYDTTEGRPNAEPAWLAFIHTGTRHVAWITLSILPTIVIAIVLVPRTLTPLTWIGEHTLYPFLFAPLALSWRGLLLEAFHPPIFTNYLGHLTVLLLHLVYAFVVLIFFASPPWRFIFMWFLRPELPHCAPDGSKPLALELDSSRPMDELIKSARKENKHNKRDLLVEVITDRPMSVRSGRADSRDLHIEDVEAKHEDSTLTSFTSDSSFSLTSKDGLIKKKITMEDYFNRGLHTVAPPSKPTWLYTFSRGFGQDTVLRSILWFPCAFFILWVFWKFAGGKHMERLYNYQTIFHIHVMDVFIRLLIYLMAPWPQKEEVPVENDPKYLARIGCLVPCHKSADEVVDTVRSLLQFLQPEHIVVVDNGNATQPFDDTRDRLRELNPSVVYLWVPIGMKTNALWMGLHKLPSAVEYVMHIDDDTTLPPDMVFDEKVWDHSPTTAISYGIVMNQTGEVEKLVDLEFKMISQLRVFQCKYSTVWFQHGIIGIWRRQAFVETLQDHPFLPFGEDNWNGTINLLKNCQMRQELRSVVNTYAPPTLFPGLNSRQQGYGAANVWKQRSERWFVNAPRRFFIRLYLLLFYQHDTLTGNIVFRLLSLLHLFEIFAHLEAPVILLRYYMSPLFDWKIITFGLACTCFFNWIEAFTLNYVLWWHRKDIQVSLKTCLLWPFYHGFLLMCYWYGHWRCLFWYIPFYPMRHGLYTEGSMTPAMLKYLHGIDTEEDESKRRFVHGGASIQLTHPAGYCLTDSRG